MPIQLDHGSKTMRFGEEAYAVSEQDEQEIGLCPRCGRHYNSITCAEKERIEKQAERQGIEPSPLSE